MQIIFTIVIFLDLLQYIIFFDIILSWLLLLWINFRPKFIWDILNPVYKKIRSTVPTSIWPLDFTPIVVIFLCIFLKSLIFILFPDIKNEIIYLLSNI